MPSTQLVPVRVRVGPQSENVRFSELALLRAIPSARQSREDKQDTNDSNAHQTDQKAKQRNEDNGTTGNDRQCPGA